LTFSQIKQEKPSQQATPNQGRQKKRGRTDSSDEAQPAAKRSNAPQEVIEVKPEPPTPARYGTVDMHLLYNMYMFLNFSPKIPFCGLI
jgi:hypothetical protein